VLNALVDYTRYRMKRGRYSPKFIEASGGRLATLNNFQANEFPKPGQSIISHTPDSFISWLTMYFTDSIWSHIALGVDHGEIVEVTLEGTVVHPFVDILNGRDYLLIYTPEMSAEQERGFAESARSGVGVTKYGYLAAAIIGLRLLAGRDINYRPRLFADPMIVLLLLCWLGRRRTRIVSFGALIGLSHAAIVLLHTKYRRTRRASHHHNMTSPDAAVRALARFPGIRGRAIDGIISVRGRHNRSIREPSSVWSAFEQLAPDSGDVDTPDETAAEMESYLRKRLWSKGKRDLLRILIENLWQRKGQKVGALPLRTVGKWNLLTSATSPPDAAQAGSVLHGAGGISALRNLEAHVGSLQLEVAGRHSPAAWFLMLKRASNSIKIELPQASPEVLQVAAAATLSSAKAESYWRLLLVLWMPTPKILTDIDELLSLSIIKRNVHVAMRRVAKGQAVRLVDAFSGVPVDDDIELEKAIELYDQRTHAASDFLKAEWLGITGRTRPVAKDSSSDEEPVATWTDLRRLESVPAQLVDRLLQDFDPYHSWATNVEEHMRVLDPTAAFKRETIAIEVLLSAAREVLSEKGMLNSNEGGTWSQYGYMMVRRRSFASQLNRLLREKVGDQAHAAQLWLMVWASSVRILYPAGSSRLLLDLEAASDWLPKALAQGATGTPSDNSHSDFRKQVQEIIDSSPWRPGDKFRHLIGQTLSIDSESSAAIDAVALRLDKLILINVNTLQAGEAFMSGDMEAIRSLRAEVERASRDWDAAVGEVRIAPEILGLETEAFDVEGVAIMPSVPFVHLGSPTRLVEGIRHVASIEELIMRIH
jgi:hypothetical protein